MLSPGERERERERERATTACRKERKKYGKALKPSEDMQWPSQQQFRVILSGGWMMGETRTRRTRQHGPYMVQLVC